LVVISRPGQTPTRASKVSPSITRTTWAGWLKRNADRSSVADGGAAAGASAETAEVAIRGPSSAPIDSPSASAPVATITVPARVGARGLRIIILE
jgi:hypothetical protein